MRMDENGTSFWDSLLNVVAAIAIVAAMAVLSVATAGTAAAVIFAGAAIGGALGFVSGGISGAVGAIQSGQNIFEGFANGALSGTITGAISGAIAASPIGRGGQVLLNAILSAGEYVVTAGQDFNWGDFAISLGTGIVAGFVGKDGFFFSKNQVLKQVFNRKVIMNGGKFLGALFPSIMKSGFVGTVGNIIKAGT